MGSLGLGLANPKCSCQDHLISVHGLRRKKGNPPRSFLSWSSGGFPG